MTGREAAPVVRGMTGRRRALPWLFCGSVLVVSLSPLLLDFWGLGLAAEPRAAGQGVFGGLAGDFLHAMLEWTALCTALFTALLLFTQATITPNMAGPIVGAAFLWTAYIDAFHALAASRFVVGAATYRDLVSLTGVISRAFNASALIAGVGLVVVCGRERPERVSLRFVVAVGALFGVTACGAIAVCATTADIPRMVFPGGLVERPWDLVPLPLYVLAALLVFPAFHGREKTWFSLALWVSAAPHAAAQLHMAFGSTVPFDGGFNAAHVLKVIGYVVPMVGMLLDYIQVRPGEIAAVRVNEGLLSEIAERVRVEAVLQASERRIRAILDSAYDAFISVDAGGVITDWNAQAEITFGWSRCEAIGRPLADTIIPPAHRRAHVRALERFLATGEERVLRRRVEVTALHRDGHELPVELVIWPVWVNETVSLSAFVHDVTERKGAEQERARMEVRLRQAQKLEAIGEVVGKGGGEKGRIVVSTRGDGQWVEVRVADSGGGIPEGIRDRVFDPFFTTKEVGKGTGQGLAIAHDVVVSRHGGTITFETEAGRGTTFIVRLPVGSGAEAETEARA